MISYRSPIIPEELSPYWDDHAQAAHERVAGITYSQLANYVDDHPSEYLGEDTAAIIDCPPDEDYDPTTVVALGFPYTNGWAPNMALRLIEAQALLPVPYRFVAFADNVPGKSAYILNKYEEKMVAAGDFTPIAAKWNNTLEAIKAKRVIFLGYSGAACVGGSALSLAVYRGSFEIGDSGLFEPINVIDQGVFDLEGNFFSTKVSDLNTSISNSGLPTLEQTQHLKHGRATARQALGIGRNYAFSWRNSTARSFKYGMTHDTFGTDLGEAMRSDDDFSVTVVGADNSRVFPRVAQGNIRCNFMDNDRVNMVTVKDQDHTMGDNIVAHGLMGKLAIFGY